jgi:plasmid replication initiation protein
VLVSRVTASSYAETFGLDIETAYEQLQESANVLHSRTITFYTPAGPRKGKPLPPTRHKMNWVGRSSYQKGEAWVEIAWWPEVVPYLTGLTEQFTTYKLQQASTIRSIYAWRMLELLTQFEKTGWLEITVDNFAEAMGASDGQRANFAKMRIQVLEQAIKELTDKDGWIIDWSASKRGRRVHSLRFEFKRDEQLSLELTPKALEKAAPPAHTPAEQITIDLIDQRLAEQRAAMMAELGIRIIPEDELAAANARETNTRKAEARAGAKAAHKIKKNRQRIEGDDSTNRIPFKD